MGMSYPAAIIITNTSAHTGRFGKIHALEDAVMTLVSPNVTDTNAHTGRLGKITCLTDSTVTLVSPNVTKNGSSTVSGIDLKASTDIEGVFTSITQTSAGSVIAYRI